jgi:hypothetical protein
MFVKATIRLIAASGIAGIVSVSAFAQVRDATEQEVRWFTGRWAIGPADAPGFETIAKGADCTVAVAIAAVGPTTIRRTVRLRSGELHATEFTVKSFNGNFPWWSKDAAGGPVAKLTDTDSFVLATTRNGKADWVNAQKHRRCPG